MARTTSAFGTWRRAVITAAAGATTPLVATTSCMSRGETQSARQFRRGLTQSTGGLGTNNFVTILERTDFRAIRSAASFLPSTPTVPVRKQPTASAAMHGEGVIETFTTVHVTPDGFLPPLALALIRQPNGHLLLAQGEDIVGLKTGRDVHFRRIDDFYVFTVTSPLQKMQQSLKKLLRRGAVLPPPEAQISVNEK